MFDIIKYNIHDDNTIEVNVKNTLSYIVRKSKLNVDSNFFEKFGSDIDHLWSNNVANQLGDIVFEKIKLKTKALELLDWEFSGRSAGYFTLTNNYDVENVLNVDDYEELEGEYFQYFGNEITKQNQLVRLQSLIEKDIDIITKIMNDVINKEGVEYFDNMIKDIISHNIDESKITKLGKKMSINERQIRKIIREELEDVIGEDNDEMLDEVTVDVNNLTVEDIADMLDLDALSKHIKQYYDITADFAITDVSLSGIEVRSDSLLSQFGKGGPQLFKTINLRLAIYKNIYNSIINDFREGITNETYYFPIGFKYEHPGGGSNGYDLGRGWIGYNFDTNEWTKA
jgi:hypothetical protein